ncbi:HflK protein [Klebsiella pneumoniae]|uniref:HflK protein n=1 Tax=Klebsiella pneumoniae TaxID=573 RepID=A0A378FSU4_KLEPN|nr:HflK protein [Klebsiella pneumoniae]
MARFAKILPEYKAAPEITRERLYIETMEKVLSHTVKCWSMTAKTAI